MSSKRPGTVDYSKFDNIDSDFASYCKFEKYELEMIAKYLDEAPKKIEKMFQDIASIV